MTRIIAKLAAMVAVMTVLVIVLAYIGYFVGMVVALTSAAVLGIKYAVIPKVFAWLTIAVGALVFVIKLTQEDNGGKDVEEYEVTEEERKEIEQFLNGLNNGKEDD